MFRILFIAIIIPLMTTTACTGAAPQEAPTTFTIGIVNPVEMRDPVVDDFIATMADLGYTEGENITYLYEGAIPDADERLAWAQSLVEQEVDLIFGVATPGGQSAAAATDSIPVVFVPVTDPIGAGLVDDLQNPGGNVTGITNGNPHGLRMQFLIDLMPNLDTVYAPTNPESPPAALAFPSVEEIAQANDITLITPHVRTPEEIEAAFANIPEEADAIFIIPDPAIANFANTFAQQAIELGLPLVSLSRSEVEQGTLLAYGEELNEAAAQAARMVDVILQGTPPGNLPVETTEYFLSLNLNTAEALGITVSDEFLRRINFVVRDED